MADASSSLRRVGTCRIPIPFPLVALESDGARIECAGFTSSDCLSELTLDCARSIPISEDQVTGSSAQLFVEYHSTLDLTQLYRNGRNQRLEYVPIRHDFYQAIKQS